MKNASLFLFVDAKCLFFLISKFLTKSVKIIFISLQPEKNKSPSSSSLVTLDVSGDKYFFVERVCLVFAV